MPTNSSLLVSGVVVGLFVCAVAFAVGVFGIAGAVAPESVHVDGNSIADDDSPPHVTEDGPITYRVAVEEELPYLVSGDVRETRFGSDLYLFAGETVFVDVEVTNDGGTTESYDATLSLAGEVIDRATGDLDAGESTEVRLGIEFESPGEATMSVVDMETEVTVRPATSALVTDLVLSDPAADPGESVTLTASVLGGPTAGDHTVELFQGWTSFDREVVHSEELSLDAGETTTVEYTFEAPDDELLPFWADGNHETFGIVAPDVDLDELDIDTDVDLDELDIDTDVDLDELDIDTDVDVEGIGDDATGDNTTGDGLADSADDDGVGFGPVAGLVGVLIGMLFVLRHRAKSSRASP